MKKQKRLAIILARGGSKRIPNKNIRRFLDRPIIAYSIEAALKSNLFDEVVVSTDSEEIARIAKQYKAKVPFMRSKKTSGDKAILIEAVREVVTKYGELGQSFDRICYLLPTAVFLTPEMLKRGLKLLETGNFDSVRPVQRFSYPVQRSYRMRGRNLEYFLPKYAQKRSQDLEPIYHDAGMFYWIKKDSLNANCKLGALEISALEGQDIDTPDDWKMAELKYKLLFGKKNG